MPVKRFDEAVFAAEWAIARLEYTGNVMIQTDTEPRLCITATIHDADSASLVDVRVC